MFGFILLVLFCLFVIFAINVAQFIYGFILTFFKRTNRAGVNHLACSIIGIPLMAKRCRRKSCDSCRGWECSKHPDNQ